MGNHKQKKVYVFNLNGELVDELKSIKTTAIKYSSHQGTIGYAIKRKSCFNSKFYFSISNTFKIPFKKRITNILLQKSSAIFQQMKGISYLQIKEADEYFRSSESDYFLNC